MNERPIGSSLNAVPQTEGASDHAQVLTEIEAKLLAGLNSPETAMTAADWKTLRQEALATLKSRPGRS